MRALRRPATDESLALLRRKSDEQAILGTVEAAVDAIFKALQPRIGRLLAA